MKLTYPQKKGQILPHYTQPPKPNNKVQIFKVKYSKT